MASANWDLIQQLAQQFLDVQQQNCSLRLSERNWIEIVDRVLKANNMTVVYTKDGKEMVTPEQLLREIKLYLDMNDGRASFSQMQDGLGVDYAVIEERCMELVKRSATSAKDIESAKFDDKLSNDWKCWRVLDQIVTNDYCDRLQTEISNELDNIGRIGVGSLATRYQLPAEFVRKLLPIGVSSKCIVDGDFVYSENFIKRATCRLVGFLSATIRPLKISAFAQHSGLPERLLTTVLDKAIASGRLAGSFQQHMFVPTVFTKAQKECIRSALSAVYIDTAALKRLGVVGDVTEVVRREWSGEEPIPLGTGFIRKSAIDRLSSTIEEACKATKEMREGAGWLDTNGVVAALGTSVGSLSQDVTEKLLRNYGGLMEMIDCNVEPFQTKSKGRLIVEDSGSSDENGSSEGEMNLPVSNDNEEEIGLLGVAPWLVEKCSDSLYHSLASRINEKRQQALTPATPTLPTPLVDNASEAATESSVTSDASTPSGTQSKRKQGRGDRKKGTTSAVAEPEIPKMYRVSKRRLVGLLLKNRVSLLAPDFPAGAIKPMVCQLVYPVVSKRLAELAALTPKSSAAATAASAKVAQQGTASTSTSSLQTELPKLIVTLASCWRGVTQHLLSGTGGTIDRDRRAMSVHLRELTAAPIAELLRALPYPGRETGTGGHAAEFLSEGITAFETKFANNDVEGAIEALRSLFGLSFAKNALNSIGVPANGLNSVLATALTSQQTPGSSNRNKKSSNAPALGVTVEMLRQDHLASGLLKVKAMIAEDTDDPLQLPNVLLLVASLTFERLTGELISCPGRLVPTLVNYLTTHNDVDREAAHVYGWALKASQDQLKPRSKSKSSATKADHTELLQQLLATVEKKD